MSKFVPALFAVAIATLGAYLWGLTQLFGAHPFWAGNVLLIGAPIGLILGLTLARTPYAVSLITLSVATLLSIAATYWGKSTFAASYAEDALAGQFWYFGWIAICAFLSAFICRAMIRKN